MTSQYAGGAVLSNDRTYRYCLWRVLTEPEQSTLDVNREDRGTVAFIMLNPSTADEDEDDPTLRRCIGFAERWGYERLVLGNLFAYRTPDPEELEQVDDPFGPLNWRHLGEICDDADRVIVGWGAHDIASTRGLPFIARCMHATADDLYCLGTTKDGNPRHPLFVKGETEPEPWEP